MVRYRPATVNERDETPRSTKPRFLDGGTAEKRMTDSVHSLNVSKGTLHVYGERLFLGKMKPS